MFIFGSGNTSIPRFLKNQCYDRQIVWGFISLIKISLIMQFVKKTMVMTGAMLLAFGVCAQNNAPVVKESGKEIAVEENETSSVSTKESKVDFKVSADVVSSYIWRGAYNAGASIQPTLGMSVGNFSLTVWGSKEISDLHKEIDITAAYSFGCVSVFVADYWWEGDKFWEKRIILLLNILIWIIMIRNIVWKQESLGLCQRNSPCL